MSLRRVSFPLLAALISLSFAVAGADEAIRIRLESEPLPRAISLDDARTGIVAFQIEATFDAEGTGSGTLGLDRSEYAFDSFGDASLQGAPKIERLSISLQTIAKKEGSRTVEMRLGDGSLVHRLALVLCDRDEPHQLVIQRADERRYDPVHLKPQFIFEMTGEPKVVSSISTLPMKLPARFEALSDLGHDERPGLRRLRLHLTGDGKGTIGFDPNGLEFDAFGRVWVSGVEDYESIEIEATASDEVDPKGVGRKRFALTLGDDAPAGDYSLILGPDDEGPHRLLVAIEGEPERSIPLHLPDRRRHAREQVALNDAAEADRNAIQELRSRIGYEFEFGLNDGSVTKLRIRSRGPAERIDDLLAKLPQLNEIRFDDMDVDAEILAGLPSVKRLTRISCVRCRIEEGALAGVAAIKVLPSLYLVDCEGITDAEMRHLEPLYNLQILEISQSTREGDDAGGIPGITDAGVEVLAGKKKLRKLNLHGQPLTDKALVTIGRLEALEDLIVSGKGITDNGILQFKPTSRLKSLTLGGTSVSKAGKLRLKRTFPHMKDFP